MIKATISNITKREAFARTGGKKIAGGTCSQKAIVRGLVLNNYKIIASGTCVEQKNSFDLNNVIAFKKQREVA